MQPKEPKYIINVQIPYSLAEKLDELAHTRKTSRTALIREAVEKMVARAK
jgi:predicted transcriptional regulator